MMPIPYDGHGNRIRFLNIDRKSDLPDWARTERADTFEPGMSHRQRKISGCLLGILTIIACNLVAGGLIALIYALVR